MGPGDLKAALAGLAADERDVLVGIAEGDDAGIVRIDRQTGLVHTIDVITPIVDDPLSFGRIAAANAVSDVFAMGGTPTSAVAFLAVPKAMPRQALSPILRGARDLLREAGAILVGGHTVKDRELKVGFAVTGTVATKSLITVDAAKPGQVLVLTKPIGTGVLYSAMQAGKRTPAQTKAMIRSMITTNQSARDVMVDARIRCATDVTGFGLAGHALNIARHSDVDLVIDASRIPTLPGVRSYIEAGIHPGATQANIDGYGRDLRLDRALGDVDLRLAADPQTSGGILMAVPKRRAEAAREALSGWIIGHVAERSAKKPRVLLRAQPFD